MPQVGAKFIFDFFLTCIYSSYFFYHSTATKKELTHQSKKIRVVAQWPKQNSPIFPGAKKKISGYDLQHADQEHTAKKNRFQYDVNT